MMNIQTMDMAILDFIQAHARSGIGDVFFPAVSWLGNNGLIWIVLAVILLVIPKTRKLGVIVAAALVLETVCCNFILKPLVARPRPFEVNQAVQLLVSGPTDYSFPSGHTGASFAAVSALFFSKNKLYIPAGILAVLIGFSRLYLYVHYPSDVLCGVLLGIFSGFLSCRICAKFRRARN
jgi:undecaprenyl-diphosphatase